MVVWGMDAKDWLTAPTTDYAEIVLQGIPAGDDPARETIRTLSDPNNYTHVLDMRTFEEERGAA